MTPANAGTKGLRIGRGPGWSFADLTHNGLKVTVQVETHDRAEGEQTIRSIASALASHAPMLAACEAANALASAYEDGNLPVPAAIMLAIRNRARTALAAAKGGAS